MEILFHVPLAIKLVASVERKGWALHMEDNLRPVGKESPMLYHQNSFLGPVAFQALMPRPEWSIAIWEIMK